MYLRCSIVAVLLSVPVATTPAQRPATAGVLSAWFHHIERDELDSLRPLLTDDFRFVSDGARMGPDAFVAMIKSLGIRSPRVTLKNIETHERGDVAYLVYDRDETIRVRGTAGDTSVTRVVPETGTLVLVRRRGEWRIAQWAATSPPSR